MKKKGPNSFYNNTSLFITISPQAKTWINMFVIYDYYFPAPKLY